MRLEPRRRRAALVAAVVLLALGVAVVGWSFAPSDPGVTRDLLPNLAAAPPGKLNGETRGTVQRPRFFLGFESAAANVGDGPLVVVGRRPDVQTERMRLRQQIRRSNGTTRSVPVRATLRYVRSADHSHWHLLDFMRYELRPARGDEALRDRKTGFCLGDRYRLDGGLPGANESPVFKDDCGKGASELLGIREGISVGWGDNYKPNLEGQEFELTALPAGRYLLVHRVNPARTLRESDYTDNTASMALDLSWPRGRKLSPAIDVVARCAGAVCP